MPALSAVADRAALAALIARVEAAVGADRELDGLIHIALFVDQTRVGRIDHNNGVVGWWPKDAPYVSAVDAERYTGSLDAAMTLVPDGRKGSVSFGGEFSGAAVERPLDLPAISSCIATPALALVAAALRARLEAA